MDENEHKKEEINDIDKTIFDYAKDSYNEADLKNIHRWVNLPQFQLKLRQSLYNLWKQTIYEGETADADLNNILNSVHHRMNLQDSPGVHKISAGKRISEILLRVAAVLFIPLLVTSILFINEKLHQSELHAAYIELNVPTGSKLKTDLPDGSTVWLNSGSKLKYPQNFNLKNRSVELYGEAYFDIRTDAANPFVVKLGDYDLKALGTSFNVRYYPENNLITSTLETGRLSFEKAGKKKMEKRLLFIEKGYRMTFDISASQCTYYKTDTEKYTSWKDGKLIFRNDPFETVIDGLERLYHTEIELMDPSHELPQHPFTLTIENETLEQVLEYLSFASPIQWKKLPPERKEDGNIKPARYQIEKK